MSLKQDVDQLGLLQAQAANLKIAMDAIKERLTERGDGAYEGDVYRATVSTSERETLPIKVAREKLESLGVSHQWFTANTNKTEVTAVRVVARTGVALKAA